MEGGGEAERGRARGVLGKGPRGSGPEGEDTKKLQRAPVESQEVRRGEAGHEVREGNVEKRDTEAGEWA